MHPTPPFAGCDRVHVVLPHTPATDDPAWTDAERETLARLPALFESDRQSIERELGAPVHLTDTPPPGAPCWLVGPRALNPAIHESDAPKTGLYLDRRRRLLISDAPDVDGLLQTFGHLRTLARHAEGWLPCGGVRTLDDAIVRVAREVSDTWPGFHRRALSWSSICRNHVWRVRAATDPVAALQRWLTSLDDFHTWVRPAMTRLVLPYGATIADGHVVLTNVLPHTMAWKRGVRPGYRLLGLDVAEAWQRVPAPAHAKPLLVARHLLSGRAGEERWLEARGPSAHTVRWQETLQPPTGPPAFWERLADGCGYLWIGGWFPGLGIEDVIDDALEALQSADHLIVDLRGNGGGRLHMAWAFRDRFLERPSTMGYLRATTPGGHLGSYQPLLGTPSEKRRWTKPVRFLTDPLTYSSSEDAILGLHGLPHVQVVGEPSGGGSGRLRRLRLLPGWRLTISSALAFDRHGRCIEGVGLPVDLPVHVDRCTPDGSDPVLLRAQHGW